ncbi:predicted pyrophosphatase [Candidatus Scalindua japonica]|uniref:Nucleoside triphosphate pyrophosphohydrolase n=1 Tax=Candidatus Scalindua japonica TaxID=1284222 RepID=A0A286TTR5_9BACT|nr:nucleoside triphosphate pyrophosphohydrolase [Candidatus Scalindua japonica]GAX59272.1 predicted pyrophosphatase [Candidatus Scalindua japonica]
MLGSNFKDLVELMETLRGKDGCPWDQEQTHESLKSCLIEEVYEIVDAVDSKDSDQLKEELADLFFLIIFYCKIADDSNNFDINNMLEACLEKMTRRHPHVFGDKTARNASEALGQWNEIKKKERETKQNGGNDNKSIVDNVPNHMPALQKAQKIQKKVARVGFDWEVIEDVIAKVHEELEEVKEAISSEKKELIAEEIGDLLFAVVNLSRFLKLDSEDLLRKSISKFTGRFKKVEMRVAALGKNIEECSLKELDAIWNEIKS